MYRRDVVSGLPGRAINVAGPLAVVLLRMLVASPALAQRALDSPASPGQNTAARTRFEDARFGLFIHWGVSSLLGKGDWVMENEKIPLREYAKLPPRLSAAGFDAAAWVKLVQSAGARYLTVSAKHHDGFCMFASQLTDYDILDATPCRLDPIKALALACKKQKISIFFYYSMLDWHHPDYVPLGKTGHTAGRDASGNWKRYVAYYQGQIRELCSNYGEIGGIWLDGWWDRPDADWDLAGTYRLIHELQPGALVGNNHRVAPFPGEDFRIFERSLTDPGPAGSDRVAASHRLPREIEQAMDHSPGETAGDSKEKNAEQLIRTLVGAAGRSANLLLSVESRRDGAVDPEAAARLQKVGAWLAAHGESIYGTRQGPIPPQPWGVSTATGPPDHPSRIYLHVLEPGDDAPVISDPAPAWTPHLFGSKTPLALTKTRRGQMLMLPKNVRSPIDTIIVLSPRKKGS